MKGIPEEVFSFRGPTTEAKGAQDRNLCGFPDDLVDTERFGPSLPPGDSS